MSSDLDLIKELREMTGAGIADIRKALIEAKGDKEKAISVLRTMGKSVAEKKSSRTAKEGIIETYIHSNNKLGVLLEIRCETDFVARNSEFRALAHELAMQIAASSPKYVKIEDIPAEIVSEETVIAKSQVDQSKPSAIQEEIIKGKLKKRWSEICLLEQAYVRNPDITMGDLVTQIIAKLGENIEIARFVRFEI